MRRHGYTVVSLDASGWAADENLHRDIAAALDFPDYYRRNLDALNDCMGDVVAPLLLAVIRYWNAGTTCGRGTGGC
jgi:RNAse (barnase) inhibitor barstar